MKLKLVMDNVNYQTKPSSDIGAIINRMKIENAKDYSIEEIKKSILEGKTIRPSYCGGQMYLCYPDMLGQISITTTNGVEVCQINNFGGVEGTPLVFKDETNTTFMVINTIEGYTKMIKFIE